MKMVTKADWIAALRSGKYKQSQSYLYSAQGQCCLGVLCDIAEVPYIDDNGGPRTYLFKVPSRYDSTNENGSMIPKRVNLTSDLDLDLEVRHKKAGIENLRYALAAMNDDGKTFNEIADYIEKL